MASVVVSHYGDMAWGVWPRTWRPRVACNACMLSKEPQAITWCSQEK